MAAPLIAELAGLRALARALVGGGDAEDLVQDVAEAALAHPPKDDRPLWPWLATVLRNRRRMIHRGEVRRRVREAAARPSDDAPDAAVLLDRARAVEAMGRALVALVEPFRTVVILRYLEGCTAAQIARELGVPPGTVRWRLKEGLARLRATLDDPPAHRRVLATLAFVPRPLAGVVLVKTKLVLLAAILVALLVGGIAWFTRESPTSTATPVATRTAAIGDAPRAIAAARDAVGAPVVDPLPGQGRATVATAPLAGGALHGRVIDWSTGRGVANAELTFTTDAGATAVHADGDGAFELAPPAPDTYTLASVTAAGFLPYAPELLHSTVRATLARDRDVRGVTVFLFQALPYRGRVVDAAGKPVARAIVKLLGTPEGEQRPSVVAGIATTWTTDAEGGFEFNAADDAVLEASHGKQHGRARLDRDVQLTRQLVIPLGDTPPSERRITGRVVDEHGAPVADALVHADPSNAPVGGAPPIAPGTRQVAVRDLGPRGTAFALADADGKFVLDGVDRDTYSLFAEADDHAAGQRQVVAGGTDNVTLVVDRGEAISGTVATRDGAAIPAFTLLAFRRYGAVRELVVSRSIVEPGGAFSIRVRPGDYELLAAATGWAPSKPTPATAGATGVSLVVTAGATLRGRVVAAEDGTAPIPYARITREALGGGASAQPANAGTVTRDDGTFELTGIPAGPLAITIGAGGRHPKIEAGMLAHDGEVLGPIAIALAVLKPGEQPRLELVGIGVQLTADEVGLRVDRVIDGGGAQAAGIAVGDHVVTVGGLAVDELGLDGAIAMIRGAPGTTIAVAIRRGDQVLPLVVERRVLHT